MTVDSIGRLPAARGAEANLSSDFSHQIDCLPKQRGFKMTFLNIVSLPKKIEEIKLSMQNRSIDIISFSETRLSADISDNMVKIPGYDIIRKDRNRLGGGVCIYARSTINYQIRNDLLPSNLEAVSIEINKPNSKPFLVVSVYRPPDAPPSFFTDLEDIVNKIDDERNDLYILGDFNCDLIKTVPDCATKNLKTLLETYQLSQLINEPTRITETSSTLIDHFITNDPKKIAHSGVIHTGISDHSLIYGIRKINIKPKNRENIIEMRNMKRFNSDKFLNDLAAQSWDDIYFFADNPNTMWGMWKDLFLQILDKHAPLQNKKTKLNKIPWINNEIKSLIIKRDKLKRKAIITKLNSDWQNYKKMRNDITTLLRQEKRNYYSNKLLTEKSNPKAASKTINHLLGKNRGSTKVNELDLNGTSVTDSNEIAESLNDYFSNIGPNLAHQIENSDCDFKDYIKPKKSEFAAFNLVSVNHVYQLLSTLSSAKATGLDKISSKLIKLSAPIVCDTLTYIFNQSITHCIFPNEWKMARVIPIFKNGKRNLPGNYRPISILPSISKIMERILHTQLYKYLTDNDILSDRQFGFRKNRSTTTALLDCTNDWYINIDRKCFNLVVLIDLKKAFDTVNHEILIKKLELAGIKDNALKLLKCYLTNRTQKCEVNGCTSNENDVKCGVPQGSILGPLFFLLYINDLPACLKSTKPCLFADDTNITATGECLSSIENSVNSDLENLRLMANKLSLNVAKTEFQIIASKQMLKKTADKHINIHIENKSIKRVLQCKTLGVTVDDCLNWKANTDNICKKVSSGIYALKQMKDFVDQKTLMSLYNAIIQPYFSYCCEVWDVFGETQSTRLQKLHNRAARIIAGVSNDVGQNEVLNLLQWEPLNEQRLKSKAKMMFKTINNMGAFSLNKLFTFTDEIVTHNLRGSRNTLRLPKPNTNYMKKSFMYSGASIWNSLPLSLKECSSLANFSRKIATHSIN